MKIIQNKKGDLPITILVIGIIAVCILTIFSFGFSLKKVNDSFFGPGLVETIYSVHDEIIFKNRNNLDDFSEFSKGEVVISVDLGGNIFIGNYTDKSIFGSEKKLLEIEYRPLN